MSKEEQNWEYLESITSRLKVPGGWIYKTYGVQTVCTVYVPDPEFWTKKEPVTAFGGYQISS